MGRVGVDEEGEGAAAGREGGGRATCEVSDSRNLATDSATCPATDRPSTDYYRHDDRFWPCRQGRNELKDGCAEFSAREEEEEGVEFTRIFNLPTSAPSVGPGLPGEM